ncbi:MAG: acetyl-CoA carboxylase biotin carboxylase subunit [Planctomycetota bacterium]
MFRKVLIANRGEIAVRVARTLQQLGIRAVAVFSDADKGSVHVAQADEAYPLEGNTSAETYLRGDKIIDVARRCHADAIHPGYGFLSENATFAQACKDAGIVFIGPTPENIRAMGDKIVAKRMAEKAGVPVVPGWSWEGPPNYARIREQARRLGYPVLIKAAAGGGGKGMRVVREESGLTEAVEGAQREAASSFADGRVFLEKYLDRPRHVEIQIFGDHHGNVVHLFERECSIQRRHQKIVEESPSPALNPETRKHMGEAAVQLAKTISYANAGTVEFILDQNGTFYFLEVNTRLQVEHPVTEMVTRRDLVAVQIQVASGEPLPFRQEDLFQVGHAMECRVCAEDPCHGFVPSVGTIEQFVAPNGGDVRADCGVAAGSKVSVYYDSMLAKLIVWGSTREEMLRRMTWALERFVVLGVTTNLEFLQSLVQHPEFRAGRLHTGFLEEHAIAPSVDDIVPDEAWIIAAMAVRGSQSSSNEGSRRKSGDDTVNVGPWVAGGGWRAT